MNYEIAIRNIRSELKEYIVSNQIKSLVMGISGGIDSCLCAALAKPVCDELGIPLIGIGLPSGTNEANENDRAKRTREYLCTKNDVQNIDLYYSHLSSINPPPKTDDEESLKRWRIRNGNLKARIRMIYLYNVASENSGIVLSTDNYTELVLGFWTLHGDVGDYGMIQNLWKTEVYEMAEWIAENEYKDSSVKIYKYALEDDEDIDEEDREFFTHGDIKAIILDTINALATDGLGVTNLGDLGQIMPDWKGNSRDGYKEVDRILDLWLNTPPSFLKTAADILYEKHPVIQRNINTAFKRTNPVNIPRAVILYGPSVR